MNEGMVIPGEVAYIMFLLWTTLIFLVGYMAGSKKK